MTKKMPTPEYLRKILRYEPDTGKLFWRERTSDMFTCTGNQSPIGHRNSWNTKFAGKEALTAISDGYRIGMINNTSMKAHRVAWALHYGEWPEKLIDHINHDRGDNRIVNLRVVSDAENQKNTKLSTNNNSGQSGVSWDKRCLKWKAGIRAGGKWSILGYFSDKQEAIRVRKAAEKRHGYHPNHGKALTQAQAVLKGDEG